jgi:hypothetical protein
MSLHSRRSRAAALRFRLLRADTKDYSGANEKLRIPRRFAAGTQAVVAFGDQQTDQTPRTRLLTFSSGSRRLVAVLVFVALLPNLALGAMFLLGVVNTPWSAPESSPPGTSPKAALPSAVLAAPAVLEITVGEDVIFPIALDGTDGVPARSIIAISGLPHGSALSAGRPYGETEWNLKTDEIGDLHLVLSSETSGDAKLTIKLVGPDGAIITETGLILKINLSTRPELAETQVSDERTEGVGPKENRFANLDIPTPPEDPVPPPTRRPVRNTSNNVDANWIKPLAFVNHHRRGSLAWLQREPNSA